MPLASLFMFNATAFVLTLALVPSLVGQAANPPAGSEFTLRTTTQLVVLNVGVQDVHGTEIKGLKANDFRVYEDGHPQVVKQFAAEDRPVTVGIVLDASGSMRTKQADGFRERSTHRQRPFLQNGVHAGLNVAAEQRPRHAVARL